MRIQRRFMMSAFFMLAMLALSTSVFAQQAPPPADKRAPKDDVIVFERQIEGPHGTGIRVPGTPGLPIGDDTVVFLSSEMSFDGKPVKNAPYSAEAITESTRTLGDGNKIKHRNSATVYRDSEGRTRRDQELGAVGPWAMPGDPQQTVFINDPVAGANYVLDPRTRVARKMPPLRVSFTQGAGAGSNAAPGTAPQVRLKVERDVFTAVAPPPGGSGGGAPVEMFRVSADPKNRQTESLGKQVIEGVEAEGTRTTMTIPAGEIGNEQAIQIVTEKWYSPELKTIVMSRHSDPLVGETVYKLTNINRSEPARSLFEVPGDYTIKEMPGAGMRVMRKKSSDEK